MQVRLAGLADAATVRGGLLNILGLGITSIEVLSFPAPVGVVLPLLIDFSLDELQVDHALEVEVAAPTGEVEPYIRTVIRGGATSAEDVRHVELPVALLEVVPFEHYVLNEAGHYRVRILIDGEEMSVVDFFATPDPDAVTTAPE